jgi:uncharacterized membrane protein
MWVDPQSVRERAYKARLGARHALSRVRTTAGLTLKCEIAEQPRRETFHSLIYLGSPGVPTQNRPSRVAIDEAKEVLMAEQAPSAAEVRRGETDRVKAFTDGVFAIIITILVLGISVPPNLSEQSLAESIREIEPELSAWVISFLITGMYWVWHRDLFNQIRIVNRDVVWLNLLFMLPTALIPFAASVLGEYPDQPIALHVYGAVLIAASLLRWILYAYVARRPKLLFDPLTDRQRRVGGLLAAAPIAVYLLAMTLAHAAPTVSRSLYFAVPLLYFGLITLLRQSPGTRTEAENYG